ncbi:helix-turn-helix domain-containing protein [Streptomyces sp. 6N223]|uniref:helix-turn-helix domain-containing protein n=1 Tax=Streptomyces sp. 6N223 TaxID=3457412 RepID=UPI003FD0B8F8
MAKELDPRDTMAALYGTRLRKRRLEEGWTQRFLGAKVNVVAARINQLERATGAKPTVELSCALDQVLNLDNLLTDLTPHVRREAYPNFVQAYMGRESKARVIRAYQTQLVHGLLQTEDYARSLLRLGVTLRDEEHLEERLAARMERQPRLEDPELKAFEMVLDEAALVRSVAKPSVMREQFSRLLEAAESPKITIQVLPFASGGHPSMECSLMMLDMPDGTEAAYQEGDGFGRLTEETDEVRAYARAYDQIRAQALPEHLSLDLIRSVVEGRYGAAHLPSQARRRQLAAKHLQQHGGRRLPRSGRRLPRRRPRQGL